MACSEHHSQLPSVFFLTVDDPLPSKVRFDGPNVVVHGDLQKKVYGAQQLSTTMALIDAGSCLQYGSML